MASFATLVKSILNQLSPCDYPVLNSQLFFKIWLTYVLDQGLTSMRALFYRLNHAEITNAVVIMDKGFASWQLLERLSERKCSFVVRIKNNMRMKLNHERYRVVQFFDENQREFRIATNLKELSDEEVSELYRQRWAIENLWKFLKMHLSLDKLITKSLNGVVNQIYMVLIAYLILELVEIPEYFGKKLLDKLRYLQLELSRRCSIVHWSFDWQPELLVT
ncbi:transposase [Thermosynechococcus sp. CL-1]|uniref:transposase n=1 Tax=Thermosynechococcus sp. CL-1 TaxID=2583530 RepID=UPI00122DEA6D|nr:transposase [Thermosynechococcus sp. CL-1]